MIQDQENLFYDAKTSVATSDVIANGGGGDAICPLFVAIHSAGKETAALTFVLETSDEEAFGTKTTLANIVTQTGSGLIAAQKLPYGCKKYLRLTCSGTPVGAITAGLVEDVDNWYK